MTNELKNTEFNTTGRQPSDQEFEVISKWIGDQKRTNAQKKATVSAPSLKTVSKSV